MLMSYGICLWRVFFFWFNFLVFFFVGVKLVLCDKNVNTFQINLMIFLRSIFLMKYWWKSVSPEGKELIQYVIDNAFMNKGIRMGKKPCNDATIVYSLFRNKLLLCNINSKSPCVELIRRRRNKILHILWMRYSRQEMHFDASFY